MERRKLTAEELSERTADLNGWTVSTESDSDRGLTILKKQYKFENFAAALAYVNQVGVLAEAADHHPDITFGWGYAELELTTHDRGGVTDVDIALALRIDALS